MKENKFKKKVKSIVEGKVLPYGLSMILAGTGIASTIAFDGCSKTDTNETKIETSADESEKQAKEKNELKTIADCLAALEEENQHAYKAYTHMTEFQDQFDKAANSIMIDPKSDTEPRLYLTVDEITSLYIYANAYALSFDTIKDIFSDTMLPIDLSKNYDKACEILSNYYRYGTKTTGLSKLFEHKKGTEHTSAIVFDKIEGMYLAYNAATTDKEKQAAKENIVKYLNEIYLSGKIDELKDTNPEVVVLIQRLFVSQLYEKQIISDELYQNISLANKGVKNYLDTATSNIRMRLTMLSMDKEAKSLSGKNIIDKIITFMKRKVAIKKQNGRDGRDINFSKYEEKSAKSSSAQKGSESEQLPKSSTSSKKSEVGKTGKNKTQKENEDVRKKLVEQYGKEAVREAEQKANEEFEEEYADENLRQQEYGKGLADGYAISYEKTYDYYIKTGKSFTASDFRSNIENAVRNYSGSYKESYKEGLTDGLATGIRTAEKDAKADKKEMEKAAKKPATTEVKEERYTEPTTKAQATTTAPTTKAPTTTAPTIKVPTTTQPTTTQPTTERPGVITEIDVVEERVYGAKVEVTEPNAENKTRVRN